jgi:hypothetical protein
MMTLRTTLLAAAGLAAAAGTAHASNRVTGQAAKC